MKNARYIGLRTNNQAEYEALIAALEFSTKLKAEEVICHLDSELVTKQLIGQYSVRDSELKKLWRRARSLADGFKKIRYLNVPRTHPKIQAADALVNEILDKHSEQKPTKKT